MTEVSLPPARVPTFVRLVDPLVRWLLGAGFPMGPNTLLTVRGRKSGEPRSAGVALVEVGGRTWVMGAYGNAQWVRNLAHAGEGTIRLKTGEQQRVRARLLTPEEAAAYFRDELAAYVRALPWIGRLTAGIFAGAALRDPDRAAQEHPVFELERIGPG